MFQYFLQSKYMNKIKKIAKKYYYLLGTISFIVKIIFDFLAAR